MQQILNDIRDLAAIEGVKFTLSDGPAGWYLGSFYRTQYYDQYQPPPCSKNKGRGRFWLKHICKLADQHGKNIELSTSVPELVRYYKSFGFETIFEIEREKYWRFRRTPWTGRM